MSEIVGPTLVTESLVQQAAIAAVAAAGEFSAPEFAQTDMRVDPATALAVTAGMHTEVEPFGADLMKSVEEPTAGKGGTRPTNKKSQVWNPHQKKYTYGSDGEDD